MKIVTAGIILGYILNMNSDIGMVKKKKRNLKC